MNQLNLLRQKAEELLEASTNNDKDYKKFGIIKSVLKDDDCFLNMDIEHAYAILRDLGVDEEHISSYYSTLITR